MARVKGDKNLSAREHRLKAQIAILKAQKQVLRAKLKMKAVRQKELRDRI